MFFCGKKIAHSKAILSERLWRFAILLIPVVFNFCSALNVVSVCNSATTTPSCTTASPPPFPPDDVKYGQLQLP